MEGYVNFRESSENRRLGYRSLAKHSKFATRATEAVDSAAHPF
jgi:hypothetical protein